MRRLDHKVELGHVTFRRIEDELWIYEESLFVVWGFFIGGCEYEITLYGTRDHPVHLDDVKLQWFHILGEEKDEPVGYSEVKDCRDFWKFVRKNFK